MTDPQWVAPGSGEDPRAVPPPAGGPQAYPTTPAPPPGPSGLHPSSLPPSGHRAFEFRPGVIPLRPLLLGDIYGAVIKAVRGNVGATVGLALLTTLVFLVPTTALGTWVASLETADFTSTEAVFPVAGTLSAYIPAFGTWLSSILLSGFVAWVVGQAVMGRRVTAAQTWEGTRSRLPQVVGATLVTTLAVTLALALILALPTVAVVAAVQSNGQSGVGTAIGAALLGLLLATLVVMFLVTRLAFANAAVVLERLSVGEGLARSWRLTSGVQFWRVLGIRLLTAVIVGLAAQILSFPLSIIGFAGMLGTGDPSHLFVWQTVLAGVSGLITGALTTPFTASVDAVLYVDQRIRREGFDVQLITAAQADTDRTWPGAAGRS